MSGEPQRAGDQSYSSRKAFFDNGMSACVKCGASTTSREVRLLSIQDKGVHRRNPFDGVHWARSFFACDHALCALHPSFVYRNAWTAGPMGTATAQPSLHAPSLNVSRHGGEGTQSWGQCSQLALYAANRPSPVLLHTGGWSTSFLYDDAGDCYYYETRAWARGVAGLAVRACVATMHSPLQGWLLGAQSQSLVHLIDSAPS